MPKYLCFLLLISCLACNQTVNTIDKAQELDAKRDSIEKANIQVLHDQGENLTKATIYLDDNIFELNADSQQDHRIIGYEKPDSKSTRLIIFSVFINDVLNNPFNCPLGAYYDLSQTKGLKIKYQGKKDDFVKTVVKDSLGKETVVYFEQQWINFAEREKKYPGELKEYSIIEKIENFGYRLYCKATDVIEGKIKSELNINPATISNQIDKAHKLIDQYKKLLDTDVAQKKLEEINFKGSSLLGKYTKEYDGKWQQISGVLTILEQPKQNDVPGKIAIKTSDGKIVNFESIINQKILNANGQDVTAFYSQLKENSLNNKTKSDSVINQAKKIRK